MTQPINLQEILETATNMFIRKKKEINTSTFALWTSLFLCGEAPMCLKGRNIAFKRP